MLFDFSFDSKFFMENPLWLAIITYLGICFVVYVTKPQYFFNGEDVKQFGCYGKNETLFPFYIVALVGGIMTYFCFSISKGPKVVQEN